jgi:hypothetical protein
MTGLDTYPEPNINIFLCSGLIFLVLWDDLLKSNDFFIISIRNTGIWLKQKIQLCRYSSKIQSKNCRKR